MAITLATPTTASEQAMLLELCKTHFGPTSTMVLRRILYELDVVKTALRKKE
jgi:hypothetical protein